MNNKNIIIAILVILLLSLGYCSHNKQYELQGQNKQLKTENKKLEKEYKQKEEKGKRLNDSLTKDNAQKKKQIVYLQVQTKTAYREIAQRKKETTEKNKQIASSSLKQLEEICEEIYPNNEQNITSDDSYGLGFKKEIAVDLIQDLNEGFNAQKDLDSYRSIISFKDGELTMTKGLLKNSQLETAQLKDEKQSLLEIKDNNEQQIKTADKQITNMKVSSTVKIIAIVASGVGGFFLGKELAK